MKNNLTPVQLLPEMLDSYMALHNDYLKTDSIIEAEKLNVQLKSIEKNMVDAGAVIELNTLEWEKYLVSLPLVKQYGDLATIIFTEGKEVMFEKKNYELLFCFAQMEEAIMNEVGKRRMEKEFYARVDVVVQKDEKLFIKNLGFGNLEIFRRMKNEKTLIQL